MKYNIASIIGYLEDLTGYKTKRIAHVKSEDDKLPLAISTNYCFYDLEFMGTQVTIAIPTELDSITPMQLAKHQAKMMEAFHRPVIFALESVASYQIARLTQAKVDFIIPGKIVFIPSMLIVLRELKNTVKEMPEKMPSVAQMLVLYHLETRTIDGLTASEIAEHTDLAYPTINVALRWLMTNNIIALVGNKQKHVQITMSKEELWKKSLPLMSSPIERFLFTDTKPKGSLMAGETAMGHYTMRAKPTTPVIAIDKATAKENAALMNKEYGDIKVEVWKYSPTLLSEGGWVDRLSLYLCMKDSEDERIQMECDTLIEEMKW
jgi:DNA-binding transcriptional ArsR family regulator